MQTCFGPNLVPKKVFCGFYLYQTLNIVASYHRMQFQGKLINQKKNYFRPNFSPFGPNVGPKMFFQGFYLYQMLDPIASYHCMHALSRKTIAPNLRKWQKTQFRAQIQAPIFFRWFYLYQKLDTVASYHCMHFQEKLMNQT